MARKFLDGADLGDHAARAAVVDFMPFGFAAVNRASKTFYEVERRHNYTTPKVGVRLRGRAQETGTRQLR